MTTGICVRVLEFGGPEKLIVEECPVEAPQAGEVRVCLTSIGMNHAELMARRGEYKLSSGSPPFIPGVEGGGIIDAVGAGVPGSRLGERIVLSPGVVRRKNEQGGQQGTYRSHFLCASLEAIPAPAEIPDDQLGALWLSYLTAWGCLVWKQQLKPAQIVAIPAASSSVGLAAAQVVASAGAVPIGLTSTPAKVDSIKALAENRFTELLVTQDAERKSVKWRRNMMDLTGGKGVDVFFDAVGAGDYLNTEIQCLANHGTIWVYGLLGETAPVDVSPLIRKYAAIRGWILNELVVEGGEVLGEGIQAIFDGFRTGVFKQHIARSFPLKDVQEAHRFMEQGSHIGKLVLIP